MQGRPVVGWSSGPPHFTQAVSFSGIPPRAKLAAAHAWPSHRSRGLLASRICGPYLCDSPFASSVDQLRAQLHGQAHEVAAFLDGLAIERQVLLVGGVTVYGV